MLYCSASWKNADEKRAYTTDLDMCFRVFWMGKESIPDRGGDHEVIGRTIAPDIFVHVHVECSVCGTIKRIRDR